MEAWSRCSPAEQVTTDSCGISSQRVDKILFYSILQPKPLALVVKWRWSGRAEAPHACRETRRGHFGEPRHFGRLFKDGTGHSPGSCFIELELELLAVRLTCIACFSPISQSILNRFSWNFVRNIFESRADLREIFIGKYCIAKMLDHLACNAIRG